MLDGMSNTESSMLLPFSKGGIEAAISWLPGERELDVQ